MQDNSDSTVEFFGLRAAIDTGSRILYSPVSAIDLLLTPISDPVARLTRECSALRLKLATAERKERQGLHKQLSPLPPNTPPSTLNTPPSQLGLHFDCPPGSHTTTVFTYTPPTDSHPRPINSPQPTSPRRTPNPRRPFPRSNKRQRHRHPQHPQSQADNKTALSATTNRPRNTTTDERREQVGMRPAERVKQLEKQLREVQELLQARDREIELLKQERDRLFSERDQGKAIEKSKEAERERERVIEKEREKERQHERSLELEREKERAREREIEKEREIVREGERESERQQQATREREREQERQREQELQELQLQLQRDRERLESDRDQVRASLRSTPDLQLRLPMRPLSTHSQIENFRDQNNYTPSLRRAKSQIPLSREDSFASTCPPSPLPLLPPTSHFPQLHVPDLGVDAEQIAQLRSLDVFLTKTDGWSGAQVIQAVEDLNSEITHFAASAVESCVFERRPPNPNLQSLNFIPPTGGRGRRGKRRGRDSANNSGRSTPRGPPGPSQELLDSVSFLGNTFAKILGSRDHAQDPMLVQLALQSSLATCCARSLALFCTGFPSKLDALLTRVFTHLHATEPQPTSSRWRSLAHKSIRILYPGLEEYAVTELISTMLKWSSSVFTLCGCSSAPNGTPQTKEHIIPQLNSPVLKAQLRRIAEATSKLARVIREDILSTAFEVVLVDSGNAYDEVGMVNAFREMHFGAHPPPPTSLTLNGNGNGNGNGGIVPSENGSQHKAAFTKSGKVLCTTELGLRCVTRKGKTSISGEVLDSEGKVSQDLDLMETRVLLPPKVVLDYAVEALD